MRSLLLPGKAVLFLSLAAPWNLCAQELTDFGKLLELGEDWSKKDDGRTRSGEYSWANFVNTQSGDVLSFVAWKTSGQTVRHSPVRQASIETFTSDGYAYVSTRSLGEPIADTIRNQIVQVDVANHAADQRFAVEAIRFSYVYEGDRDPPSMAHGYAVAFGEIAVFVQHTSKHIITSELASNILYEVIWRHFRDATSIPNGWSALIMEPKH